MPRSAWVLMVMVLTGLHAAWSFTLFHEWMDRQSHDWGCSGYLEDPGRGWMKLKGCELVVSEALLESEAGDFETLENRRKGLSTKLFDAPPKWAAVWLPITSGSVQGGPRAVLRSDTQDLVKWVNALEGASDAVRDRMWEAPVVLRRMSRPGQIEGFSEKPAADTLRRAYGSTASVNLYVIRPGAPEPMMHPSINILAGLFALGVVALFLNKLVKKEPDLELTPEQVTARNIVGKTRVELGELERLREEERAERRSKKG